LYENGFVESHITFSRIDICAALGLLLFLFSRKHCPFQFEIAGIFLSRNNR
jgi:hypothetical protein